MDRTWQGLCWELISFGKRKIRKRWWGGTDIGLLGLSVVVLLFEMEHKTGISLACLLETYYKLLGYGVRSCERRVARRYYRRKEYMKRVLWSTWWVLWRKSRVDKICVSSILIFIINTCSIANVWLVSLIYSIKK